jgi:FixJ family two-component response regulator
VVVDTHQDVVVIDDDPRVRESIKDLLESAGYSVRLFPSADEILHTDDLTAAGCLITDVRMPGVDGCELQRRTTMAYPELPVIFVTAHHDDEVRQRTLDSGAFAFIFKPFDGEELLKKVAAALRSETTS